MLSAKEKERELIVSLREKGKTVREIADLLEVSKSKVGFWMKRYEKTGSLKNKPRSGRPTLLTKKNLDRIFLDIKSRILSDKGKKAGISSKEVLAIIEQKTGAKYTLRHTQRVLHKVGLSLTTPRASHIKRDKGAQENFRREFKKNLRQNIWVIQS